MNNCLMPNLSWATGTDTLTIDKLSKTIEYIDDTNETVLMMTTDISGKGLTDIHTDRQILLTNYRTAIAAKNFLLNPSMFRINIQIINHKWHF